MFSFIGGHLQIYHKPMTPPPECCLLCRKKKVLLCDDVGWDSRVLCFKMDPVEISKINWFTPRQAACSEPGYFFWLFLDLLEQGIGKQLVYTDKEQWDKWPSGIHITLCHLPPPPVIRHIDRNGSILDMNF